jgi:hypothetical protein
MWMLPRRNGLARIVLRKTSLVSPTITVVERDISNENVVVYERTGSLS